MSTPGDGDARALPAGLVGGDVHLLPAGLQVERVHPHQQGLELVLHHGPGHVAGSSGWPRRCPPARPRPRPAPGGSPGPTPLGPPLAPLLPPPAPYRSRPGCALAGLLPWLEPSGAAGTAVRLAGLVRLTRRARAGRRCRPPPPLASPRGRAGCPPTQATPTVPSATIPPLRSPYRRVRGPPSIVLPSSWSLAPPRRRAHWSTTDPSTCRRVPSGGAGGGTSPGRPGPARSRCPASRG